MVLGLSLLPYPSPHDICDLVMSFLLMFASFSCSHEIKRYLLLGRKTMTNLDRVLKNIDITLSIKVLIVKAMVFPVVIYGYEGWTTQKAEH